MTGDANPRHRTARHTHHTPELGTRSLALGRNTLHVRAAYEYVYAERFSAGGLPRGPVRHHLGDLLL